MRPKDPVFVFLHCHPERGRTPESKDPYKFSRARAASGNFRDDQFAIFNLQISNSMAQSLSAASASSATLPTSKSGLTGAEITAPAPGRRLGRFTQTECNPSTRAGAISW